MAFKRHMVNSLAWEEIEDFVNLEVSFETGFPTTHKIYFRKPVYITGATAFVTKALAATDAGTITLKNNAGTAMTAGQISIAASSALGFEPTPVIPTANNDIGWGQCVQITVAKTTAGGQARVQIYFKETI